MPLWHVLLSVVISLGYGLHALAQRHGTNDVVKTEGETVAVRTKAESVRLIDVAAVVPGGGGVAAVVVDGDDCGVNLLLLL